ncbi:MAG TPA: TlpA disulfide reductase family protein [Thermoguttaceae bacterium]|nr:TlpA disulfide reductase family protein [Thermoguttaceae bacterium]
MQNRNQSWSVLILICLLAACCGCPNEKTSDKTDAGNVSKTNDVEPKAIQPAVPTMPEVHMSEATEATCKVFAEDPMREADLPDLQGAVQRLPDLYGKSKLTVLFFWIDGQSEFDRMVVVDDLALLQQNFAGPLAEKGVQVIGVNVGDSAEVVRGRLAEAEATFANFLDGDRKFFAEVATEGLPRVYLLDEKGKILWFDAEFSENSRKTLFVAIEAGLGEILEE